MSKSKKICAYNTLAEYWNNLNLNEIKTKI